MKFVYTVARLFVAGLVYLAGSACSLEAALPEAEAGEATVLQVQAAPHDAAGSADGVQALIKHAVFTHLPDHLSFSLSKNPDSEKTTHPLVSAHGPRAPPNLR